MVSVSSLYILEGRSVVLLEIQLAAVVSFMMINEEIGKAVIKK